MVDPVRHDIVVVGAGPAGSTAGFLLSRLGYDVLLIDKARFPRPKLCGGLLTRKTMRLLRRVLGETVSTLREKHILEYWTKEYEICLRGRSLLKDHADSPFYFVDRQVYDNFLLEHAMRAGATVIQGERILKIDSTKLELRTSEQRIVRAHVIVGADGANSVIRRRLIEEGKVRGPRRNERLATGLGVLVDRGDIGVPVEHPIFFLGIVDWGYAWAFPNREQVMVGLGGLNVKNRGSFRASFNTLMSILRAAPPDAPKVLGHPIPFGSFLSAPATDNIILIGDAAGLVDPMNGEGIFYAQRSGELAASAIHAHLSGSTDLATSYCRSQRRFVLPQLARQNRVTLPTFGCLARLPSFALKMLLAVAGPALARSVQLFRPYESSEELSDSLYPHCAGGQ